MKRAFILALMVSMAGMAVIAGCRTVPDPYAWGEPVNGVQLRVALAASGPPALSQRWPKKYRFAWFDDAAIKAMWKTQ